LFESQEQIKGINCLSDVDIKIFKLLGKGCTYQEIMKNLIVCKSTIEKHRKKIMQKLKLKNNAEIIKKAIELKLV